MASHPPNGVKQVSGTIMSIPISPNDAAVPVFERTLRSSVHSTLNKLHLQWNSISLWRRGTNPGKPADCPVTIVITTAKIDTPVQNQWQSAVNEIKQNIHAVTKLSILVEIVEEDLRLFIVQGLPYPRSPPVGYSLGPLEENIAIGNNTGTVGGYISLTNESQSQYILTCNHVANPRDFMGKDAAWDYVQHYKMLCPSNCDNSETIGATVGERMKSGNSAEIKHLQDSLKKLYVNLPVKVREELAKGEVPSLAYNWTQIQNQLDMGDSINYYEVGSILSALMQRKVDKFTSSSCPMYDQLQATTTEFRTACVMLLSSPDLVVAKKSITADPTIGVTKFASGKRVGTNPHKEELPTDSILDWALVEVGHHFGGTNSIIHMREEAKKYAPGKGLAQGTALHFGTLLDLKKNESNIVFKQGRTTGLTMGRVSPVQELLSAEALLYMRAILPTTKSPDGEDIILTFEWTAVALTPAASGNGLEIAKDRPFAMPGDSGAWVITEDAAVVGMVWSGTEKRAYITDMAAVNESVRALTSGELRLCA